MSDATVAAAPAAAAAPSVMVSPPRTEAVKRQERQRSKQAEPSSWGEALQRYHSARTTPAHPALLSPTVPSKAGAFNSTLTPAAFNPLRGSYTSPQRESAVRDAESKAAAAARAQAQQRRDHQAYQHGYDIVSGARVATTNAVVNARLTALDNSHSTKVTVDPATGARLISVSFPPSHPPARDYNILTNTPTFTDSAARLAEADRTVPPLHNRALKEQREYNILTNHYQLEPHSPRARREAAANEAALRDRYFSSAHYNPVTLQFVHPAEEARYQEARAAASASHGQHQLAKLPPSLKRGEGRVYDIVAPNTVKDPAQLAAYYEQPERRAREAHQLRYECDRRTQIRDVAADDAAQRRALARVSDQRHGAPLQRGFEIITNEQFGGRGTKQLHVPRDHKPSSTSWARVAAEKARLATVRPAGRCDSIVQHGNIID